MFETNGIIFRCERGYAALYIKHKIRKEVAGSAAASFIWGEEEGALMRFVKFFAVLLAISTIWAASQFSTASATTDPCASVKPGTKVLWGKDEVMPYQIGRVTILKDTPAFTIDGSKKTTVRTVKAGEKFRVYSMSNVLGIDNGLFVANNPHVVKLELVSANLKQLALCVRAKNLDAAASQMLLVKASATNKTAATLQMFTKVKGKWVAVSKPVAAVIGKKGVGKTTEGDALTPEGTYLLGTSFGWGTKPAGMSYPFRSAGKYDYWIDEPQAAAYNQWVHYTGDPYSRWTSFERLTNPLYKYAVVIRYNDDPIVRSTGSAIFLHIKTSTTHYTLGCVAISESDLLKVMKWLNPKDKPIIKIEK